MDGLTLGGLQPAALRLLGPERVPAVPPGVPFVPAGEAPVDSVEIANAVRPPDAYDSLRMILDRFRGQEPSFPSLTSIMEAIQRYLAEALHRAQLEHPDFFQKLKEQAERLKGAKNGEDLQAVGEFLAAGAPSDKDRLLAEAEGLINQALDPKQGLVAPGEDAAVLELKVEELKVAADLNGPSGLAVRFEGVRLSLSRRSELAPLPGAVAEPLSVALNTSPPVPSAPA